MSFQAFTAELADYPFEKHKAAGGGLDHKLREDSHRSSELLGTYFENYRAKSPIFDCDLKKRVSGYRALFTSRIHTQRQTVLLAAALCCVYCKFCIDVDEYSPSRDIAVNQGIVLADLCQELLKNYLNWNESDLILLMDLLGKTPYDDFGFPLKRVITLVEKTREELGELSEELTAALRQFRDMVWRTHLQFCGNDELKLVMRADKLLNADHGFLFVSSDAWTDATSDLLESLDPVKAKAATALLEHASTAKGSKPTRKYLKQSIELREALGAEVFGQLIGVAFSAVGKAYEFEPQGPYGYIPESTTLHEDYSDMLRGLVWLAGEEFDASVCGLLSGLGERCYQKVPGVGPRNVKVGNAAVWVLASKGGMDGIAEVNRLLLKAKHASVRKQIQRNLDKAAEAAGMSRDDLDDIAVPRCELTGVGQRIKKFGEYTAELSIVSGAATQKVWHTPAGKTQKTVPQSVKESFPEELKAWKAEEKRLKQTLQSQRDRLERVFLHPRVWSFENWSQRIIDHPLMAWLARRLIWSFRAGDTVVAGAWHEGQWVDAQDVSIEPWLKGHGVEVGLWHPVDATAEAVETWREWLIRHEVTQPIKQAHREIYVLTDAERETHTYSNRFAAHIVRQHQLLALCQSKGWTYQLLGNWDGDSTPTRVLPGWDMRVEFYVDFSGDQSTSDTGVWLVMSTDQVRFYECDPNEPAYMHGRGDYPPLALEQVPTRVFSEVMRDVDMFVAVAGIGADPNWLDQGEGRQYHDYWYGVSFGELTQTAATRKQILERLIPRLKIADRCTLTGKYLVVKGDVRTYKIHLGSGNILMEPNDQYLCIVPGRGAVKGPAGKVFLPFEGDRTLSIILSKAFMLAEDTKITDPTILNQIGRNARGN